MRSRLLPFLALGALVLYLAAGVPLGLRNSGVRLRAAWRTLGRPPAAVRAQVFGPHYVAGVERLRQILPLDEPYLLAEQDIPGAMLWVRFDLLPRRAVVAAPGSPPGDCWLSQIRWVVVAVATGRSPLLFEKQPAVPPGCPPAPWRVAARAASEAPAAPEAAP